MAILEGVPGAYNAVEREIGFERAAAVMGLVVAASQPAFWETAKANQIASSLLTEIPDLKGFLCANDSMALGAVAAVKAAGREGQVLIAGFDNISAVRELVKNGRIVATADQHGDRARGLRHRIRARDAEDQGDAGQPGDACGPRHRGDASLTLAGEGRPRTLP